MHLCGKSKNKYVKLSEVDNHLENGWKYGWFKDCKNKKERKWVILYHTQAQDNLDKLSKILQAKQDK